ncbi:hypothetical protein LB819_002510 [Escherichia coli]|nr:hypothetical protein [Escherichia coli]EID5627144.1 hypothetical protein [Escherichia coli]
MAKRTNYPLNLTTYARTPFPECGCVAKWVKELDHKKLDDVLNNRAPDGKTHELSS